MSFSPPVLLRFGVGFVFGIQSARSAGWRECKKKNEAESVAKLERLIEIMSSGWMKPSHQRESYQTFIRLLIARAGRCSHSSALFRLVSARKCKRNNCKPLVAHAFRPTLHAATIGPNIGATDRLNWTRGGDTSLSSFRQTSYLPNVVPRGAYCVCAFITLGRPDTAVVWLVSTPSQSMHPDRRLQHAQPTTPIARNIIDRTDERTDSKLVTMETVDGLIVDAGRN